MNLSLLLSDILILTGLAVSALGVFGIFRFRDFYTRILISAQIDTVGFMTIMAGIIVRNGLSPFSLKVLLILVIAVITTPLSTHFIARSAFLSGLNPPGEG